MAQTEAIWAYRNIKCLNLEMIKKMTVHTWLEPQFKTQVLDKLENIVAFLILLNSVPSFHSMTAFLYIKKKKPMNSS